MQYQGVRRDRPVVAEKAGSPTKRYPDDSDRRVMLPMLQPSESGLCIQCLVKTKSTRLDTRLTMSPEIDSERRIAEARQPPSVRGGRLSRSANTVQKKNGGRSVISTGRERRRDGNTILRLEPDIL
nr:hypothetical protein [Sphingomonas bacterium]